LFRKILDKSAAAREFSRKSRMQITVALPLARNQHNQILSGRNVNFLLPEFRLLTPVQAPRSGGIDTGVGNIGGNKASFDNKKSNGSDPYCGAKNVKGYRAGSRYCAGFQSAL
jgi:hypothetical protein